MNHVAHPLRYKLHFDTYFLILLNFIGCFNKHGNNSDNVTRNGYPRLSSNQDILKKSYDSTNDVTNKVLSRDSSYI